MKKGTCIIFILFYVYRHYKRIGVTSKRSELISDLTKCHLLLEQMEENNDPNSSIEIVGELIDRVNRFGASMKLEQPLRYADAFDSEIIMIMKRVTREIIDYAKRPFYKRYSREIFARLSVLHNLPRSLLSDSSGDMSTVRNFHISKQEALDCVRMYLENEND